MTHRFLSVVFLAACGSHATDHVGKVTAHAQQGFKDWCAKGRLEMETKLDELPERSPARTNPNLLVMDCYRTGDESDPTSERGFLALDSKTSQLIWLNADLHPSTANAFFERILVPSLDEKQKTAFDSLLAWARTSSSGSKRWDTDALSLVVQVYPASGSASEAEWHVHVKTALQLPR